MKFINGYWIQGNGMKVDYATQAYEVTTGPNSITVLATTKVITTRGLTQMGPNLEITYSSQAKDIIKVSIVHFKGALDNSPKFELNEDQGFVPEITNTDTYAELVSGDTKVVIQKSEEWDVAFYHKDSNNNDSSNKDRSNKDRSNKYRRITGNGWRSTGYAKEDGYKSHLKQLLGEGDYFFDPPSKVIGNGDTGPGTAGNSYVFDRLDLGVGECIYGFGEKFTTFVKNGQTVEVWNADGGTCSDQTYKSIPFYVSSKGYGMMVNTPDLVSFEVASEVVTKVSVSVKGEALEYFIIGGNDIKEVLANYTGLTGKPALPPAYSFGLWLSTSFTTDYNEETVNSFIDGMADRDIPLEVFHFDCFWMKEHEWCNMEWDLRQFPDPKAMLDRLKGKGLELCCWINPYVGQRSRLFDIGAAKGYFVKNPDGSVFQTDFWQPGLAIVDFTNPEAAKWYAGLLKDLFDMGIRNIKTDFGERIPTKALYHSGHDPIKMHNYYTYLFNKVVYEALVDYFGENETCLFARSATVGGQKFPVHWGGDCFASYEAMAETLRAGLSLCASGFGFFSHDISGFESTATADLYKRWCAFGLLSTHSRLHGSKSYRVPWLFDEESCDVLRFYTKLKGRLMPYLYAQAVKTSVTGIPMMRPIVMEFPNDPSCKYLDTQYMLGDSLLVAPVFNEEGIVEFYLPEGKWTDIVSGEVYAGGRYYERKCGYLETPILARENSVIGFGAFRRSFDYDYVNGTEFVVYAPTDGVSFETDVYDSKGKKAFAITVSRKGQNVTARADNGVDVKVQLVSDTNQLSLA